MRITPLIVTGALVAVGFAGEAGAAPKKKKPITKSYQATAAAPDPTNYAIDDYSVCAQTVPGSFHSHTFKAPAAGKLKIDMTGFMGDWDLLLVDSKGVEVGYAGASDIGTPATAAVETMTTKIKRAGSFNIIACNWAGGSTANVKYTFTFA